MKKIILTSTFVLLYAAVSFAADWNLDKVHSSVNFSVRHMVVSKTKGNFGEFDGKATFETTDLSKGSVTFNVKVASVDTDNAKRDDHLRSTDFFDVEKYPEMTFVSKKISDIDGNNFNLTGDMTIKDVTREITFACEFYGQVDDPWGNTRSGFSAKSKINRQDFNITWSNVLETGGLVVGDDVDIELEVEWIMVPENNDSNN